MEDEGQVLGLGFERRVFQLEVTGVESEAI